MCPCGLPGAVRCGNLELVWNSPIGEEPQQFRNRALALRWTPEAGLENRRFRNGRSPQARIPSLGTPELTNIFLNFWPKCLRQVRQPIYEEQLQRPRRKDTLLSNVSLAGGTPSERCLEVEYPSSPHWPFLKASGTRAVDC
jgi:hypothetical protein